MNRIDYSPQELLPILDLWEKFVGIKDDRSSNKVPQPKYYPLRITEDEVVLSSAKKGLKWREEVGRDLLAILTETTFSKQAARYLESVKIKDAVTLLLQKR
jgi:hypothetical protein